MGEGVISVVLIVNKPAPPPVDDFNNKATK
jgi:hypothetical protein